MIPIYLCEDEPNIRKTLKESIEKYLLIENYDMGISYCGDNPVDLLACCKKDNAQGIYFFDIDLKRDDYDGFTLGKKIREFDKRGFLIFITTHHELTFETFRLHLEAMDYIVKDDMEKVEERVRQCIDVIQKRISSCDDENEYYALKIFDTVHHIPISEILYFETSQNKHRLILHTTGGLTEFFGSLFEIEEAFATRFLRIHRSFLVNAKKIRSAHLAKNKVELINGEFLPLSRKAKKEWKLSQ